MNQPRKRHRRCKAKHDGIKCNVKFDVPLDALFTEWCSPGCREALALEKLEKVRLSNERAAKKAKAKAESEYNKVTKARRDKIAPNKKKTGSILKEPIDFIFSHLVRERANWICECCGMDYSWNKQQFDCSHFQSRNNKSTRYHPLNAMAHCRTCHSKLGKSNEMSIEYDKVYGEENRIFIVWLSNQTCKMTKDQLDELMTHYKAEEERMKKLRAEGFDGYIEFSCPQWYYKKELQND